MGNAKFPQNNMKTVDFLMLASEGSFHIVYWSNTKFDIKHTRIYIDRVPHFHL